VIYGVIVLSLANVGPWLRMAKRLNLNIKYWSPTPLSDSPFSLGLQVSTLEPLLSESTRLVAFTATSNILGHSTDVKGAISLIKEKTKAMTVVDCVAAAVHTRIDMVKWGCDAVLFSYYKVS
jgi:selenocysteine lyase/cysteine desulfurase